MIKDLLQKNRSYRRFRQEPVMSEEELKDLIKAARLSPSARNDQPLKYFIIRSKEACDTLFPFLAWAGYLDFWKGPSKSERPTSYIIMLQDKRISEKAAVDAGIALQSILLTAVEKGFGGCILGAIQRDSIRESFQIADDYDILYVLALGKPSETVQIEEMQDGNTHYYRSEDDIHHVPKRDIKELILGFI